MRRHRTWMSVVLSSASVVVLGITLFGQAAPAPNPYKWDESWKPQLPDGREWGSSAGVGVDRDGNIYVAERCGGNPLGCVGKKGDAGCAPFAEGSGAFFSHAVVAVKASRAIKEKGRERLSRNAAMSRNEGF